MEKLKRFSYVLIGLAALLIPALFFASKANDQQISGVVKSDATFSRENPLLKNYKPKSKTATNQDAAKNLDIKFAKAEKIKVSQKKAEVINEEFQAKLQIEANSEKYTNIYIEVLPVKKELTDEEIYKMHNAVVLDKIVIEEDLGENEQPVNDLITLTIPAKIFYAQGEQRNRAISNAEFSFNQVTNTASLKIGADTIKLEDLGNKILIEKNESGAIKVGLKVDFNVS